MDPQQRLFLECCWEALEQAGYDSGRPAGRVGVFGGASMNTYLLTNLLSHLELVASADTLQASLGNDKDPLTTRVSYKLNLKGPSVTVQTACSTSLVAVHLACQSLLNGECDMALAGGVSIHLPELSGYLFHEGGTTSPDGHCRTFDARAKGFVSGNGCGVVVLKRLADALRDGDHIHAVIRGSALQQRRLAQGRLHRAQRRRPGRGRSRRPTPTPGSTPTRISYVEGHGTGDAARRPDRGRRPDPGLPRPHRPPELLRHRLGEDQHRPPRLGGRRHRPDQDGARAASTGRSRRASTSSGRTRRSTSPTARSSSTRRCATGRPTASRGGPA